MLCKSAEAIFSRREHPFSSDTPTHKQELRGPNKSSFDLGVQRRSFGNVRAERGKRVREQPGGAPVATGGLQRRHLAAPPQRQSRAP
eukprot:6001322-Pyramimonas_sp.AAC.1